MKRKLILFTIIIILSVSMVNALFSITPPPPLFYSNLTDISVKDLTALSGNFFGNLYMNNNTIYDAQFINSTFLSSTNQTGDLTVNGNLDVNGGLNVTDGIESTPNINVYTTQNDEGLNIYNEFGTTLVRVSEELFDKGRFNVFDSGTSIAQISGRDGQDTFFRNNAGFCIFTNSCPDGSVTINSDVRIVNGLALGSVFSPTATIHGETTSGAVLKLGRQDVSVFANNRVLDIDGTGGEDGSEDITGQIRLRASSDWTPTSSPTDLAIRLANSTETIVSHDTFIFKGNGNITMFSPDGTAWDCGVSNAGTFSCS